MTTPHPAADDNIVEGRVNILRVSNPVYWGGAGIMLTDTNPNLKVIVTTDDGRQLDVTSQLGEMVALGIDQIGYETGVVDDDPVQVAEVSITGHQPDDRFYLINVLEKTAVEVDATTIQRAVAAATKRLLEEAIREQSQTVD